MQDVNDDWDGIIPRSFLLHLSFVVGVNISSLDVEEANK